MEESSSQGWSEGPEVGSMSIEQAQAEIKSIEGDPSFAGDGPMDHWSRQQMLRRRDALYKRANPPERIAEEKARRNEETKSWLESKKERFEIRDEDEEIRKAEQDLILYFGGEKEAKAATQTARSVVKRFATKSDLKFLEETDLGNDPELIKKLAEIGDILKRGGQKKK